MAVRELWVEIAAASGFLLVAAGMALGLSSSRPFAPAVAVALVVTYALAARIRLFFGAGSAVPTQVVLVPMLFVLPTPSVPALVGSALVAAALFEGRLRGTHAEGVVTGLSDGWHAVGPSLVLFAVGEPAAHLAAWPVLAAALLAQSGVDLLASVAREWLGRGITPALQARVILSVYLIDACLTPVGLLAAVVSSEQPFAFVVALPLLALLAALASDRRARIEEGVSRLDELREERERLESAIRRVGEAFASKLDRTALSELVVRTAVQAVDAKHGRAATSAGETSDGTGVSSIPVPDALDRAMDSAQALARRHAKLATAAQGPHFAMAHPLAEHTAQAGPPEVVVVAREGRPFSGKEQALFGYLANQAAIALANVDLHNRLHRQATRDELTGLANHRRFQELLAKHVEQTRRSGRPLALVMLDIDDFKAINDTYGHQQGDLVLRHVAAALRRSCRPQDEPARYGGEELAAVFPDTDLEGAFSVGERIRRAIQVLEVPGPNGTRLSITASVGVATLTRRNADGSSLVAAADAALYDAKRSGKNRTVRQSITTHRFQPFIAPSPLTGSPRPG